MSLPTYNHSFTSELINYSDGLPNEKIDEGLALPRETFIEDLEKLITDMQTRREYYYEEVENYRLIEYCINFLAILKTDKGSQKILEVLTEEEEFFDFWFADFIEPTYISFLLYDFFVDNFDLLLEIIKEKEMFYLVQCGLIDIPAQVAVNRPEKRAEAIRFYDKLIEFALTQKKSSKQTQEFALEVDQIIQSVLLIEGKELKEKVFQLHDKGLTDDMFSTREQTASEFSNPIFSTQNSRKIKLDFNPYEIFDRSIMKVFTHKLSQQEAAMAEGELEEILKRSRFVTEEDDFELFEYDSSLDDFEQQINRSNSVISHKPSDLKALYGRNDKVTVKYEDGKILENVKYKKVEKDVKAGKCEIVK